MEDLEVGTRVKHADDQEHEAVVLSIDYDANMVGIEFLGYPVTTDTRDLVDPGDLTVIS
jgi:hypothetical protein